MDLPDFLNKHSLNRKLHLNQGNFLSSMICVSYNTGEQNSTLPKMNKSVMFQLWVWLSITTNTAE